MDIIQKKRGILNRIIQNIPDKDIAKVFELVTDYQKLLIPYDDKPLTEEEKSLIEEFESGKMKFVPWEEIFVDDNNEILLSIRV